MFDLRFLFVSGTFFLDAERLKARALVGNRERTCRAVKNLRYACIMLTGRHDKKSATMKTFFHELKNRRVYRVAITCVIAGSATVSSRRFRPGLVGAQPRTTIGLTPDQDRQQVAATLCSRLDQTEVSSSALRQELLPEHVRRPKT